MTLTSSCDYTVFESFGNGSNINSFALSSNSVDEGNIFTINMDLSVEFIANIYLREIIDNGGIDTSIFYTSVFAGVPNTLTYKYENGNLLLDGVVVASVKEGKEYKIYAKVCDFTNSCIISNRHTIFFGQRPPDGGTETPDDENTINLDYLLLGGDAGGSYVKMSFFTNSITKNLLITNTEATEATVSVNALNDINFTYEFSGGLNTTTLAPSSSDTLTLGAVVGSIPSKDTTIKTGVFTLDGLTLPPKTVKVQPIEVVPAMCATFIPGNSECNYNIDDHTFSLTAPDHLLAGFALDQELIDKLQAIPNAKLEFDADFFTKFTKDPRTTCVIDANNVIAIDKQCFVFISSDVPGATSNLTATGTGIGVGGNGVSVDSIKFIFTNN